MASAPLRIEPATEEDVPLILELIRGLADYEKAKPGEVTADESTLRQSLFGPSPAAEVLIGYLEDHPVGFAVYFHNFSTWRGRRGIYLEDLFVKPEMRGRGFGKALFLEVARIANQRGCPRMEWAVLDWNEPAIQFYKSLGAASKDEWTLFRLTGDALRRLAH